MADLGLQLDLFKARVCQPLPGYHASESLENRASPAGSFSGSEVFGETERDHLEWLVLLP